MALQGNSPAYNEWVGIMHALNVFDFECRGKTLYGSNLSTYDEWVDYLAYIVDSSVATRVMIRMTYDEHNSRLYLLRWPGDGSGSEVLWSSQPIIRQRAAVRAGEQMLEWLDNEGKDLVA